MSGAFVAVGFSNGAGMAQWVGTNRPEDARGVVMVGGGMPMRYPTLAAEYDVEAARLHTERVVAIVGEVGRCTRRGDFPTRTGVIAGQGGARA